MPNITLPDGNKLEFKNKVTGLQVAEKISKSLAKQALIMSVDDELKDLSFVIQKDSKVKITAHFRIKIPFIQINYNSKN